MTHQLTIDFVAPRDRSVTATEAKRLSGQSLAILNRLKQGPASNHELAKLALKYTSRLSDLRKAGYEPAVKSRDYKTGEVVYELKSSTG